MDEMLSANLDLGVPLPPDSCRDKQLYLLIRAIEVCLALRDGGRYEELLGKLRDQLATTAVTERVYAAVDDPFPDLRALAGRVIVERQYSGYRDVVVRLANDTSDFVREGLYRSLYRAPDDVFRGLVMNAARHDRSPVVRSYAARALAKMPSVEAILALVEALDHDHEVDEDSVVDSPSQFAAEALDEILDTDWTQKHLGNGVATLPDGGVDLRGLREQAMLMARRLQNPPEEENKASD